jgi:hypothetical protein
MMRGCSIGGVEIDSQSELGKRRDTEVYTAMPAEQTLHVLKRSFLPQVKKAICNQFNIDDQKFVKMLKIIKDQWDNEDAISKIDFIKPIDALEWMKYGRLPSAMAQIEAAQAQEDFGVSPIPPQND